MNVFVYPYHFLPQFETGDGKPSPRLATVAATLLFFDTVTVGRPGFWNELNLPDAQEAMDSYLRVTKVCGQAKVDAWFYQLNSNGLTFDDIVALGFGRYWSLDYTFINGYKPLLQEGVLQIVSLAKQTQEAQMRAEATGSDASFSMTSWIRAWMDVFLSGDENQRTSELVDDLDNETFFKAFVDSDGLGLMAAYLGNIIEQFSSSHGEAMSAYMSAENPSVIFAALRQCLFLDVLHQSLLSCVIDLPIVTFEGTHLSLRTKYGAWMQQVQRKPQTLQGKEALTLKLFTETMIQVPAVIPRSAEALLEVRAKLSDELQGFRNAVTDVAEDLMDADTSVDTTKISQSVRQKFARPLRDLEQRLAHPNRDLARNLFSGTSIITNMVTFSSAMLLGGSDINAALLGLSVPVLTQSLKTLFDRNIEVEKSGVSFLLRAKGL